MEFVSTHNTCFLFQSLHTAEQWACIWSNLAVFTDTTTEIIPEIALRYSTAPVKKTAIQMIRWKLIECTQPYTYVIKINAGQNLAHKKKTNQWAL